MALSGAKHTFIFQGEDAAWTESWYRVITIVDLEVEMGLLKDLALERKKLLSPDYKIVGLRVHDQGIKGSGFPYKPPGGIRGTALGDPNTSRDVVQNCMNARAEDASGFYKRPVLIRGCPDDWTRYVEDHEIDSAPFIDALAAFGFGLSTNQYAMRCITRNAGENAVPIRRIEDMDLKNVINPPWVSVKLTNHGFVAQDPVRIEHARFVGNYQLPVNDPFKVIAVPNTVPNFANWFSIPVQLPAGIGDTTRYWDGGTVQKQLIQYFPLAAPLAADPGSQRALYFERFTQRRTGNRPTFLRRGRSRAVRKLH